MKALALYGLAASLYVTGGAFMKYSEGLTRLLPTLALGTIFTSGALVQAWAMKNEDLGTSYVLVLGLEAFLALLAGTILFDERITIRSATGVALVLAGIAILRI